MALGLLACVFVFALAGCQGHSSGDAGGQAKPPRLSEVGASDTAQPEDTIVIVLHDLAAIFEEHAAAADGSRVEPGLQAVRDYLMMNREAVTQSVAAIESKSRGLSEPARTGYVEAHQAELRAAMERFARAQQAFRAVSSEAQRIELSEILNSLE